MELTPDQAALADAIRTLLTRHEQAADHLDRAPASYDRSLWTHLSEIGVAGLAVPERYGGAGAGPVETHVVAEELGRRLTPSPLLGSAVLAAEALLACGDDATRERLLPAIADGTSVAALAWTGGAGHWDPAQAACAASGTPGSADAWVLDGDARYVLDGDTADILLVAAHAPDGIGLFEIDPARLRGHPVGRGHHGHHPPAGHRRPSGRAGPPHRRPRGPPGPGRPGPRP